MTTLTAYGGVGEVGGNQLLLEDGPRAWLLDFGLRFKRYKEFYEEYLRPRPGAGLFDPLIMELIPPLQGIYREDLAAAWTWEPLRGHPLFRRVEGLEGVLLTHAHLDHSGYISFLREDIPVCCSALTAFIAKVIQDSGRAEFDRRVCYFAPAKLQRPTGWQQEAFLSESKAPHRQRPFRLVDRRPTELPEAAHRFWTEGFWRPSKRQREFIARPLEALQAGGVRWWPVDHSIPGATAWAVETEGGWVVYTGDLRLHGRGAALTERFVEEAAALRPTALIVEGTRAGDGRRVTEEEVAERALRVVKEAAGRLVIADFGPRNVERLVLFLEVARLTGRALAITPRDAYLLRAIHLIDEEVPDVASSKELRIYQKTRADASPDLWQRGICEEHADRVVLADQVRRSPGDYILCFSFFDLNELPSLPRGGLYLYSSSEPHDEEEAIDFRRLHRWLEHFGMEGVGLPREASPGRWEIPPEQRGLHASGHASGPELIELVRRVRPRVVIPVHSEDPGYFQQQLRDAGMEVCLPERGRPIVIG